MRVLALFSGGLDSCLAVKVMQEQGIDVIALNFVSYFFGGTNERAEAMAKSLGVQLEYIDFKEAQLALVKDPPSGYGKGLNPCIDCHALMINVAQSLLPKYDASFLITGEVVGQRPMSQNSNAMRRICKLTGDTGLLVRPLSGQILEATVPEQKGWIKREKLLRINGRGRKDQLALADKYGIVEFPTPSGGCLLTDPQYSNRLKIFKKDDSWDYPDFFHLLSKARLYRLAQKRYLLIGRNEAENTTLASLRSEPGVSHYICADETTMGPDILFIGDGFESEEIEYAKRLYARYSQTKGKVESTALIDGESIVIEATVVTEDEMKKYLVT